MGHALCLVCGGPNGTAPKYCAACTFIGRHLEHEAREHAKLVARAERVAELEAENARLLRVEAAARDLRRSWRENDRDHVASAMCRVIDAVDLERVKEKRATAPVSEPRVCRNCGENESNASVHCPAVDSRADRHDHRWEGEAPRTSEARPAGEPCPLCEGLGRIEPSNGPPDPPSDDGGWNDATRANYARAYGEGARTNEATTDWRDLATNAYLGWLEGDDVLGPMQVIAAAIKAAPPRTDKACIKVPSGQTHPTCKDCFEAGRTFEHQQRAETALRVDWISLSAEAVHKAIKSRPPLMGPWEEWSFARGRGFSRHEVRPMAKEGNHRFLSVQQSNECWLVSGLGEYGTYETALDKEAAFKLADECATEMGWKLLDVVPTGSTPPSCKHCKTPTPEGFDCCTSCADERGP